jgi:hypothetical protein
VRRQLPVASHIEIAGSVSRTLAPRRFRLPAAVIGFWKKRDGMAITINQAYAMLRNNTEAFLNRYPVRIAGDPRASHETHYRMEDATSSLANVPQRPGSVLRHLNQHDTRFFWIRHGRNLVPGPVAGTCWFNAHSVKMWDASKPNDVLPYTLPAAAGASLMVTGELTGCSFAIHDNHDGSLVVTHIKPHLLVPGEHKGLEVRAKPLQKLLEANTFWDVVYGGKNYDSGQRRVSIVGCRTASGWKIYAQKLENLAPHNVRTVKRIY